MEQWVPVKLGGLRVTSHSRVDGVKLITESGDWCLVRASGTEPVFRIYVEAASRAQKETILAQVKKDLCCQAKEGVTC